MERAIGFELGVGVQRLSTVIVVRLLFPSWPVYIFDLVVRILLLVLRVQHVDEFCSLKDLKLSRQKGIPVHIVQPFVTYTTGAHYVQVQARFLLYCCL